MVSPSAELKTEHGDAQHSKGLTVVEVPALRAKFIAIADEDR